MWDKIKPEEMTDNVFRLMNEDWMLVAAENAGKVNAMTASWGGLGILWGKRVAFVFVRPSVIPKNSLITTKSFPSAFSMTAAGKC